jgi:bifunctional DNA-binding transcriptional regulator/antitoxin component of YhaV-PrlF toxin-antitoxin module
MDYFHGFVSVQSRGTVALPPVLRRRYHLDEAGAQVEIIERQDGVFELRPVIAVPASQAWFWAPGWQEREREVDAHIAAGQVLEFAGVDSFLEHLDELADDVAPAAAPRSAPRRTSR